MPRPKRSLRAVYLAVALVAAIYIVQEFGTATRTGQSRTETRIAQSESGSIDVVERAFAEKRSDFFVTIDGRIQRILSDDREEPRHQRFIVELPSGHTVLIAHNIDLAPRVEDIATGQPIRVRGEYEWNPQGGVIHWTHHDPSGRLAGGWIEHDSRRYD